MYYVEGQLIGMAKLFMGKIERGGNEIWLATAES
jgi:hypothetical protein